MYSWPWYGHHFSYFSYFCLLKINNNSHIRKAVFVYDVNKNFICKYEGVTKAQQAFNINHSIIKKYAKIGGTYNGYIFSYERLIN